MTLFEISTGSLTRCIFLPCFYCPLLDKRRIAHNVVLDRHNQIELYCGLQCTNYNAILKANSCKIVVIFYCFIVYCLNCIQHNFLIVSMFQSFWTKLKPLRTPYFTRSSTHLNLADSKIVHLTNNIQVYTGHIMGLGWFTIDPDTVQKGQDSWFLSVPKLKCLYSTFKLQHK